MAIEANIAMSEQEQRNFMLSTLASTQAMLAVVLRNQATLLAKANGTTPVAERKAIAMAVGEAERGILAEFQTPAASVERATARRFGRGAAPSIV